MLSRRTALQGLAAAPLALAQRPKRPHVLFIAVDDLNVHLGSYGFPVKSPHIDSLARRGVRFDRAYCQYPLCNPSRSSMLSGRYPTATRIWENNTWFRKTMPAVVTLPQYFRENGYATAQAGKIFHNGLDDDKAWEIGGTKVVVSEKGARPPNPASVRQRQTASDRWVAQPGDGSESADYKDASRIIDLISKPTGQPMFLALGFHKPHAPFIAPKKYFDMYDPASIKLPADFAPKPTGNSPSIRANWDLFSVRDATPELAREAIAAYYACISFIDDQVGRVLAALDAGPMRDNTVIVLFGDNGWHLGQKGIWGKTTLFEPSCRVPLFIAAPGAAGAGKACARNVEFADVYPTLVDVCGLPARNDLHGTSLAPLLRDPARAWDRPAFTFLAHRRELAASVRDARYRYTEWPGGGMELYDYEADPHELRNAANDPKSAAVIARLKPLLRAAQARTT